MFRYRQEYRPKISGFLPEVLRLYSDKKKVSDFPHKIFPVMFMLKDLNIRWKFLIVTWNFQLISRFFFYLSIISQFLGQKFEIFWVIFIYFFYLIISKFQVLKPKVFRWYSGKRTWTRKQEKLRNLFIF